MRSAFCLLLALAPGLSAQVSLKDLPALARARADRLRPAQDKALEPFWPDLALDYMRDNAQYLDGRIAQVVALGDSVVPALLEKLQPVAASGPARNLASNCRRVLEKLDPGSFLDALIELSSSNNEVGRIEAIQLLGRSRSARAVPALLRMFGDNRSAEVPYLLVALTHLRDPAAAATIAPMLGSSDRQVRSLALDYLVVVKSPAALTLALQGTATEMDKSLLPKYIEYIAAVAHENEAATKALLAIGERERLDWRDTKRLVQVLATVAPKGHDAAIRRLQELLDTGDTGPLGLEAAITLRALGDKNGLKKLLAMINEQLKKPQRRLEPQLYEDRANLLLVTGDYKEAADDFEKVFDLTNSPMLQRKIRLQLVRCEAHRNRFDKVLKHLKDGGVTYDEIMLLAQEDQAVMDCLQRPSLRNWLQAQPHDGKAGK